jgi:hypothetical protein
MHLAEVLDSAERGETVVIERHRIRFQVVVTKATAVRKRAAVIQILDPAVDRGDWTWKHGPAGLTFAGRKRK